MDRPAAPPRRRGLLDPDDLRGSHLRSQGTQADLDRVRRWVLSVLLVSTILHLAAGTAALAAFRDDLSGLGQVVLLGLSACVGVIAVVAGRLIHERRPLSTWLVLGLVPALVGTWLTLS
ncbi:hypothetical protein [Nocardioides marmoribigeumensis]|uniref:Uncharacterized protein n=1 Tax=Nocardioides marmoribigeumensis TaxID=433649 RepID=A0ABU2C0G7_9ACTN|nr:hypothetical protein [Nocardioides marmoribigeumensis]MDR7364155.1 hypothetical protein [Nocardioides marmoribigeumensis]